jgi:hypothetical protein
MAVTSTDGRLVAGGIRDLSRNDQRTTGDQRPARLARLILARYGEASP